MSNRYRLTLAVEFSAGDDPGARLTVTRNMDTLTALAGDMRACLPQCPRDTDGDGNCGQRGCPHCEGGLGRRVKVKLQRLNDDAPPRALVVETL